MVFTPEYIWIFVLAAIAIVAIIGWLFRKDDAIEERRSNMIKLYAQLHELGLERLAGFAKAYIVGDYSGLYRAAKELFEDIMDPNKADLMLSKAFYSQLAKKINDPIERIKITSIMDGAKATVTSVTSNLTSNLTK